MLGGWTSANYAATICYELPICQGNWLADGDFVNGFKLWGHGAENYEFGILDSSGRIAIHASHRIGAIVATLVLAFLAMQLIFQSQNKVTIKIRIGNRWIINSAGHTWRL